MPEKMVGLNTNVHGTITVGAGGGCRWESLTFPWGCVSSILPQSSRVVLDACLSTGSTRRWQEPEMGCRGCKLVGAGRRGQGMEKMLGAPS